MQNLTVKALAGTGKTSTIVWSVESLYGQMPEAIQLSKQQQAIMKEIKQGTSPESVCFAAFNVSTRDTMEKKLSDVPNCDVTTMHSLGLSTIRAHNGKKRKYTKVNKWKTNNLIEEIHDGVQCRVLYRKYPGYVQAVKRLAQLCKYTSPESEKVSKEQMLSLVAKYSVDLSNEEERIFETTQRVLELAKEKTTVVDFDDMIWLPNVLRLPIPKYELLLVDESQDLNTCQQFLALKAGERIAVVGDEHQAIYGFAGADTESMSTMASMLSARDGLETLPLTVTRRCGQAIVEEAKEIVPEFEAHPSTGDGEVCYEDLEYICAREGSKMILCRINAPLIREAFVLINAGVSVKVLGDDIRGSLIGLINMLKPDNVNDLVHKTHEYEDKMVRKIRKTKYSESACIAIQDKCSCLRTFCNYADSIREVIDAINELFDEEKRSMIVLSSIHKAKGLEADNVYIIKQELLPHPLAKSPWQVKQEMNLKYVAITRAKKALVWC